jgi:hypothetical protein
VFHALQIRTQVTFGSCWLVCCLTLFFRATKGFRPGAIVRVTLKDFMTYSAGELRPGPRLNVILGPNGTGKSSIVCGIGEMNNENDERVK